MRQLETPLLFIVFNRPDCTKLVLNRIKDMQPKCLFIAGDGPRTSHIDDADQCRAVREIIEKDIDWKCEVKTLFRERNLGCGKAVSESISWFFRHVNEGIILEDDCLPNGDFFAFCEQLLAYYRNDNNVMHIGGGTYPAKKYLDLNKSYYFSKYPYSWGWATWKRAWSYYDFEMTDLHNFLQSKSRHVFDRDDERDYWTRTLNDVKNKKIDTWDFQWNYTVWQNNGYCVHSTSNFIKNIGFDSNATHTKNESMAYKKIQLESGLPLVTHPKNLELNRKADRDVFEKFNKPSETLFQKLIRKF
jgi:hypothetical protein